MSILPTYTALVLFAVLGLVIHAKQNKQISLGQTVAICGLWACLLVWTGIVILLGQSQWHLEHMHTVPLLWQALIPVVIWMTGIVLFKDLREGLVQLGRATPVHWLVAIQALRVGAIGGVSKGLSGEIASTYVFWVGIPDMLFGVSALLLIRPAVKEKLSNRFLLIWSLVGAAIILLPSFLAMPYWMAEPGFSFIFEYPMVLAPSIVVSLMVSMNLLQAYTSLRADKLEKSILTAS